MKQFVFAKDDSLNARRIHKGDRIVIDTGADVQPGDVAAVVEADQNGKQSVSICIYTEQEYRKVIGKGVEVIFSIGNAQRKAAH